MPTSFVKQSVLVFRLEDHVLLGSWVEVHALEVESEELFQLLLLPNCVGSQKVVVVKLAPILSLVFFDLPFVLKS